MFVCLCVVCVHILNGHSIRVYCMSSQIVNNSKRNMCTCNSMAEQ